MKSLVIYHANCADGFGAAFAAWLKLGDEAEYLPMDYNQIKNANDLPSVKGREVYILDFSLPLDIMLYILAESSKLVWLDHHISSQPLLAELQNAQSKTIPPEMDAR